MIDRLNFKSDTCEMYAKHVIHSKVGLEFSITRSTTASKNMLSTIEIRELQVLLIYFNLYFTATIKPLPRLPGNFEKIQWC